MDHDNLVKGKNEIEKVVEAKEKVEIKEEINVGGVCKASAVLVGFAAIIGSVVLANTFAIEQRYGRDQFNWGLFLGLIVVSFLFCLTLYALGSIVEYLDWNETRQSKVYDILRRMESLSTKTDEDAPDDAVADKS